MKENLFDRIAMSGSNNGSVGMEDMTGKLFDRITI